METDHNLNNEMLNDRNGVGISWSASMRQEDVKELPPLPSSEEDGIKVETAR